ncbi:MAG: BrnT family toxin [Gammaproteobacteria bacterium]
MDIEFEDCRTLFVWDMEKAQENQTKHDVEFTDAVNVFRDPHLVIVDAARNGESRDKAIGMSSAGKLLSIVHVEVDDEFIRIISAWPATVAEIALYD